MKSGRNLHTPMLTIFTIMANDKRRIVVNGDIHLDTVTVYSENQIKVDACPWMADKAQEVAPDGRLRIKGRTVIEPGAQMVFMPYRTGTGSRYQVLFKTEHCDVMRTQGGKIIERWCFNHKVPTHRIWEIRKKETQQVNAFYLTLK